MWMLLCPSWSAVKPWKRDRWSPSPPTPCMQKTVELIRWLRVLFSLLLFLFSILYRPDVTWLGNSLGQASCWQYFTYSSCGLWLSAVTGSTTGHKTCKYNVKWFDVFTMTDIDRCQNRNGQKRPYVCQTFCIELTMFNVLDRYAMKLKSHAGPGASQEDKQLAVLW